MNPTTKRTVNIVFSAALLAIAIAVFAWFNVRGAEFTFLDDLPNDCDVTVTRRYWDGVSEQPDIREYTLTQEQFSRLLDLVRGSSYWRDPSSVITYSGGLPNYDVFIRFNRDSSEHFLSITVSGDYAIRFSGSLEMPLENVFLRIRTDHWLTQLEAIFAS